MNFNEIIPEHGKFYRLAKSSKNSFGGYINLQGRYMGFNPNRNPWFIRNIYPEGHIFVVMEEKEFKVYNTRTDRLMEDWVSDGEDGPEYPIGIAVKEWEGKLRGVEIEFLEELFSRVKEKRRAA